MKTLVIVFCGALLCLLISPGASTAVRKENQTFISPTNDMEHLAGPRYSWMSLELLPNGEYIGRTEGTFIIFTKHKEFVMGLYYSGIVSHSYCFWGIIAPSGELLGQEITVPKIYVVDDEDPNGDDDEEEVSVALENFKIESWEDFKQSHKTRYKDAIESASEVFGDCNHFFAVRGGSS